MRQSMTKVLGSQQGAALLILMLALFMVTVTVLLKGLNNRGGQLERQAATIAALIQAKEALIGYAVIHAGRLPCPDTDPPNFTDGFPQPPYGLPNAPCTPGEIGRLPHSLPDDPSFLADFGSGIDQQFWYAVGTKSTPLTVDGRSDIAAVLIAPGPALTGQNRPSTNRTDYLEDANSSGIDFSSSPASSPETFNDLVVSIAWAEILTPVSALVAEEIRGHLDSYHAANSEYPADQATFETALAGAPSWLADNGWLGPPTPYTRVTPNEFSLTFSGCSITYTVTFGTMAISRSQPPRC